MGVTHGLEVAWNKGFGKVHVKVDSILILQLIEKGVGAMHPLSNLIMCCQGFIVRGWVVMFNHVYMEGNKVADSLTNFAFSIQLGCLLLDSPPSISSNLMLEDLRGVCFPRMTIV